VKEWVSRLDGLKLQIPVEFVNRIVSSMDEVNRLEREISDEVDAIFVYLITSESTRFTYLASKRIADLGYDYIHEYGGYGIPTVYVIDLRECHNSLPLYSAHKDGWTSSSIYQESCGQRRWCWASSIRA